MTIQTRTIFKVLSLTVAFFLGCFLIYLARVQLVWIGVAIFLSIALNPLVERFTKLVPSRSRLLGTASVFLIIVGVFSFLVIAFAPPLVHQTQLLVANFPQYTNELIHGQSFISETIRSFNLVDRVRDSQNEILSYASSAGGSFWSIVSGIFSSFAAGVTVLALTFFMLLEGPGLVNAFWRMVPQAKRAHSQKLASKMYDTVTGYVTGNGLTSILAATLTAIILTIVGVPYAIPLAIVVAILDFVPLVGASIAAVIVIGVSLFTSLGAALVMAVFFVLYQLAENHVLQPLIYGKTVQMSPLLVFISVLIGAGIGGVIGAIVAIPIGASLQILVRDLAEQKFAGRS